MEIWGNGAMGVGDKRPSLTVGLLIDSLFHRRLKLI